MKVFFLCGCAARIIHRENVKTMDTVSYDDEGMLVCTMHGQRRQGWRSLPNRPGLKLADWNFKSLSPTEVEAWVVFNEPPMQFPSDNMKLEPLGEDRRDNRDPESLVVRVRHIDRFGRVFDAPPEHSFFIHIREGVPFASHLPLRFRGGQTVHDGSSNGSQ